MDEAEVRRYCKICFYTLLKGERCYEHPDAPIVREVIEPLPVLEPSPELCTENPKLRKI